MRTHKSNFVSKSGIIFLAAVVLVAAYFKLTDVTAFLGLVLFLSLCAYFWSRAALSRVSVSFRQRELYAFPGEEFDLELELCNEKGLLLMWLDLVLLLGEKKCIGRDVTEHFSWIMPHQSISLHSSVQAAKRGTATLKSAVLRSGDGFCLSEEEKTAKLSQPVKLVVYPAISPIDPSPLLNLSSEPEPAKNGLYTDRTLINNVRPYSEGDNFKDINWRMMARTDDAVVNVHETMAMRRIGFILDLASFSYEVREEHTNGSVSYVRKLYEKELEDAISKVASYIVALNDRDIICTLVIPSTKEGEARILVPQSKESQIIELLSALAEIDYSGEESFLPEAEMESESYLLGQIYKIDYKYGMMKLAGGEYEEIQ